MKAIENFAFGIAFGLALGLSYGMQHPMTTTLAPVTTTPPAPVKTAAAEPGKEECEPQPVFTVPKFLGPYKRGNTGVMHALLSFYEMGPGSINHDEILANGKTSIGRNPIVGRTIAVDPKVIPYGSRVFIPGLDGGLPKILVPKSREIGLMFWLRMKRKPTSLGGSRRWFSGRDNLT